MRRLWIAVAAALALGGAALYGTRPGPDDRGARVERTRPAHTARVRSLPELRIALAGDDAVVRGHALDALAVQGEPEGVRILAEVAGSRDRLANKAAAALGAVRAHGAAGVLRDLVAGDAPVIVRANAARALAAAGDAEAGAVLAQIVRDSAQPARVRQEAALALAKVGGDTEVPALIEALGDQDEQVRISALQALRAVGGVAGRRAIEAHARGPLSRTERAFVAPVLVTRAP